MNSPSWTNPDEYGQIRQKSDMSGENWISPENSGQKSDKLHLVLVRPSITPRSVNPLFSTFFFACSTSFGELNCPNREIRSQKKREKRRLSSNVAGQTGNSTLSGGLSARFPSLGKLPRCISRSPVSAGRRYPMGFAVREACSCGRRAPCEAWWTKTHHKTPEIGGSRFTRPHPTFRLPAIRIVSQG